MEPSFDEALQFERSQDDRHYSACRHPSSLLWRPPNADDSLTYHLEPAPAQLRRLDETDRVLQQDSGISAPMYNQSVRVLAQGRLLSRAEVPPVGVLSRREE